MDNLGTVDSGIQGLKDKFLKLDLYPIYMQINVF
jgi:hypothetical protein